MRRFLLSLIATVTIAAGEDATFPLPAAGYTRTLELRQDWRFAWDDRDEGVDAQWFALAHDRGLWKPVAVPGVWEMAPGRISPPYRSGVGWYALRITVPADWQGQILLHALGAMYMTDVWANGDYLGTHRGGYTPFAMDLSGQARPGHPLTLVLRVDNRLTSETVPNRHMGWQPYGGLTRQVYLACRPLLHVAGLAWDSALKGDGSAVLHVSGRLENADKALHAATVIARLGAAQVEARQALTVPASGNQAFSLSLAVARPRLWSPDDPHLYSLDINWSNLPEHRLVLPVALRTVATTRGQLLLNNTPIWLQGFGLHEEWAGCGPCVPRSEREGELRLLKDEYRINALRPGHYPNHPDLYAVCDRLGILVFTELPVWQVEPGLVNGQRMWDDWHLPQIDDLVDTYRCFGCVIGWGVQNEQRGGQEYSRRAVARLRERDPSRLPYLVMDSTVELENHAIADLSARNLHYGWYHSPRVYALRQGLAANLEAARGKPLWVAELGAHAVLGHLRGTYADESRGSEFYQDKVLRFGFQYCATQAGVVGVSPWTWADFGRGNRIEPHGVVDAKRQPKLAAYTLRNLFAGDVRVYVCETDSTCQPGGTFEAQVVLFNPRNAATGAYRCRWRILGAQGERAAGELLATASDARSVPCGAVRWPIPADAAGFHSLWLELSDDAGRPVHTNACHFGVTGGEAPGVLRIAAPAAADPARTWCEWQGLRIPVYRHPGLIVPLPAGTWAIILHHGDASRRRTVTIQPMAECRLGVEAFNDG